MTNKSKDFFVIAEVCTIFPLKKQIIYHNRQIIADFYLSLPVKIQP